MDNFFTEVLDTYLKRLLPLLYSVLILLAACIPYHFTFAKYIIPDLGIMCVYYWASYRRDLFGAGSAFILGLLTDCLYLTPVGLNVFAYLLTFVLTNTFRSYVDTRAFATSWSGFALVTFAVYAAKWLLASIYYSRFLSLGGIILGCTTTILLYPLVAWVNVFLQKHFVPAEEVVYEQG